MRKTRLFLLGCLLTFTLFTHAQTLSPSESSEVCPGVNIQFQGTLSGEFDDVVVESMGDVQIVQGVTIISSNTGSTIFTFIAKFNDFPATQGIRTKYRVAGSGNNYLISEKLFTKVKSIATDRIPVVSTTINAPLCQSTITNVSFNQVPWRNISLTNFTFGGIPTYQYSVPAGWKVAGITSAGPNDYIVAGNNAAIEASGISAGVVLVRAYNDCATNLAPGPWVTIPNNRPALNLKTGGLEALTINCGSIEPRTFTVENGNLATCATFTWTVGGGWLYNGSPAPSTISTGSTPSITLTPVSTTSQPPSNIGVTITAGAETVTDQVQVTFTNDPSLIPITLQGLPALCVDEPYQLAFTGTGYRSTGATTWTHSPLNIITISADPSDPTNDKKIRAARNGTVNAVVNLTATYDNVGCGNSKSQTLAIGVGKPKPGPITVLMADAAMGKIQVEIDPVPGATSYKWYKDGVAVPAYTQTWAQISVPRGVCDVIYGIQVEAINPCGTSLKTYKGVYMDCDGGRFMVSPNPVESEEVTVSQHDAGAKETGLITEVKVYDLQGTLKVHRRFNKVKSAKVSTANLKNGTYIVEIVTGTKSQRKQILIHK